jgi:hypothetical protein
MARKAQPVDQQQTLVLAALVSLLLVAWAAGEFLRSV